MRFLLPLITRRLFPTPDPGGTRETDNKTEERMTTDADSVWSDPSNVDVVQSVLERMSFPDFFRSKSVCSLWNSAAKHCLPKPNQVPWLLLFPTSNFYPNSARGCCKMFNPDEDRIYSTSGLGRDFSHPRSRCIATCGNWLLIIDGRCNLFVCNVFTRERMELPPLTSLHGPQMRILGRENRFSFHGTFGSASFCLCASTTVFGVLCVDDTTRDYSVVLKILNDGVIEIPIAAFCKSGDNSWSHVPTLDGCHDMTYADGKLYVHDHDFRIRVFALSKDLPRDITAGNRYVYQTDIGVSEEEYYRQYISMAVDNSGNVLFVVRRVEEEDHPEKADPFFSVYKIDPRGTEGLEKVDSLGGEALVFDMGRTVRARNIRGVEENSIYFSCGRAFPMHNERDLCVYNVTTGKIKRFEKCQSFYVPRMRRPRDARWFVPTFSSKAGV